MSFLYLLLAVVLLGVIITAHEFGHYIVARLTRVKVEEFAVGMGPKIVGWRKNGIDYSLRAIPLGGFCRFTGEDEKSDSPDAFSAQKALEAVFDSVFRGRHEFCAGLCGDRAVFGHLWRDAGAGAADLRPGGRRARAGGGH